MHVNYDSQVNFKYLSNLEPRLIDRRETIRRWELEHRPFPPQAGSVSKPRRRSLEPEPEEHYLQELWVERAE